MPVTRTTCRVLICLCTFALAGCGGSDRPELATASGIVTLDGEPVEGASVTFVPLTGGRPGTGITDGAGRYTIKTYSDSPGAIVGDHRVAVMKISGPGAFVLQEDAPAEGAEAGDDNEGGLLSTIEVVDSSETPEPEIIYDVPQKYMNANESGLQVTVRLEGSDTLNLELSK